MFWYDVELTDKNVKMHPALAEIYDAGCGLQYQIDRWIDRKIDRQIDEMVSRYLDR